MTLADFAPIGLTMPLIASLVLTLWSRFWFGEFSGPMSEGAHVALVSAQLSCVVAAFIFPGALTMLGLAALYAAMALGGARLIVQGSAASCGCWGRSEKALSWRLVSANLLLSLGALAATQLSFSAAALPRLSLLGSLILLTYFVGVTFVEWRHSYPEVADRANLYRAQVFGFRDLESKS